MDYLKPSYKSRSDRAPSSRRQKFRRFTSLALASQYAQLHFSSLDSLQLSETNRPFRQYDAALGISEEDIKKVLSAIRGKTAIRSAVIRRAECARYLRGIVK